ncbi:MAG: hypothetical protein GY883_20775 [Shimia sp.]|nr:hypothetical protein [Shimia sp.]
MIADNGSERHIFWWAHDTADIRAECREHSATKVSSDGGQAEGQGRVYLRKMGKSRPNRDQ